MDNFSVDSRHNFNHLRFYPMERGDRNNLTAADEAEDITHDSEMPTHYTIKPRNPR